MSQVGTKPRFYVHRYFTSVSVFHLYYFFYVPKTPPMPMTTCRACNDDDDDDDGGGGSETVVGAAAGVYPRRKSIRRRIYIYYILVHTHTHTQCTQCGTQISQTFCTWPKVYTFTFFLPYHCSTAGAQPTPTYEQKGKKAQVAQNLTTHMNTVFNTIIIL